MPARNQVGIQGSSLMRLLRLTEVLLQSSIQNLQAEQPVQQSTLAETRLEPKFRRLLML